MMEANEVFNEHERKKENEAEVHARIQVAGREACIGGPSCGGGGTGIGVILPSSCGHPVH
jgi:hypothetical protein